MSDQSLSKTTVPELHERTQPVPEPTEPRHPLGKAMTWRLGVIPLPVYLLLVAVIGILIASGGMKADLPSQIAFLGVTAYTCYEIGRRIPVFRRIGGPVILTIFLPAFLVSIGVISPDLTKTVTDFYKNTNFLYMFIAGIIVGSILSMDRKVLIRGFLKIFVPLAGGSVAAAIVGTLVGTIFTHDMERTFFYVVVPIMSGGLGEGVIPLSLGYTATLGGGHDEILASMIPIVLLANVTAIILCACMAAVGRRFPHLTGNGQLQPGDESVSESAARPAKSGFDVTDLAAGGFLAVGLYLLGVVFNVLFEWPAPIVMLVATIVIKLLRLAPKQMEDGAGLVYKLMRTSVTYPLLFAIGVASTPWASLMKAITLGNVVTIVATVATLLISSFFIGKWIKLYPVDTSIVIATHSGLGGTGDVAILEATDRMALMPFAQIATRIGGAATVTMALAAYALTR